MPRPPRIDVPGLIYHVISRGARQLPIFHDDQDRQMFLRLLIGTRAKFAFRMHAYCLMTNHFHLLLQTLEDSSLSELMQFSKHAFSRWINMKYERTGHLFQGRFHSIPVQTDAYFTTVASYIHLNPVRAGIVALPEEYAWSNYGRLIRGEQDSVVEPGELLNYFGAERQQQLNGYRRYVEERMSQPEIVTEQKLRRMRSWGHIVLPGTNGSSNLISDEPSKTGAAPAGH
jgi:putative transposase